ncbi:MAG: DUF58 domain-containing protein [Chloroflexi bacterium]|nr:DUF58 domain-containing protein [Chloroflexota bacterium]MBV9602217.1 DUF58 domain-containing protein [Chloroflexota bacterium]
MMDSPEARPLAPAPWLFGRQGLALLALVTAIAATFLATDVTYLAGALLIVGLTARAWAALAFARVTYTRTTSRDRAFRGDELILESTLGNPRILPLPWVEVWEQLPVALRPESPRERSFIDNERVWVSRGLAVWPYRRVRWRRKMLCTQRGVFRLGDARLRTGDPFGFFERERSYAASVGNQEVLVYPRVVPLRRLALPLHHPSLDIVSPRSHVTDPTRTATIREYRPDDPPRLIHWSSTARRGSLHVRVLEPATSLHVSLLLDVRGFSFGVYREELLESTLSAIGSIAVFLQGQGSPTSFLANTATPVVIPPGASVPHLQSTLESLARLASVAGPSLAPWATEHLPAGNTVILCTSDVSPDLGANLGEFQESGLRVLLILASSDEGGPVVRGVSTLRIAPGCDLAALLEGRAA